MDKMIAADTSRYATGNRVVPVALLSYLKAERKVELFIPGAWHGVLGYDGVGQTLRNAISLDMKVATYLALTRAGGGESDVLDTYKLVGDANWRQLSFVAIDMEWGNPLTDATVAKMNDLTAAVQKVISLGQRPVLYTAAWWWKGHFGNPPIPFGLPLWNAFYDNDPDFDFQRYPYGGTGVRVIGEQFTNSTTVVAPGSQSISVDYNAFDAAWVKEFPATSAMEALVLLRQAWEEDMRDTMKGASALRSGPIDPTALGLFGLYNTGKAQNWARLIDGGGK